MAGVPIQNSPARAVSAQPARCVLEHRRRNRESVLVAMPQSRAMKAELTIVLVSCIVSPPFAACWGAFSRLPPKAC